MSRILVLSAGAGAGHNRAAEAVAEGAAAWFPSVTAEWADALEYTNKVFRKSYAESYVLVAGSMPSIWGMLYSSMGKNVERKLLDTVVNAHDKSAYKKLADYIQSFRPDALVCTHFLPANVAIAKKMGIPVHMVVTDYDVHKFWINRKVDHYYVASEEVKWQMGKYDFPADRVTVTGIPIHPVFQERRNAGEIRKKLGLQSGIRTVLFMSGGFGMGDMANAVEAILSLPDRFQLVVVCGRNEKMKEKLDELAQGKNAKIFGFVTNPEDFMEVADFVITKAGGLTVSECLTTGTPMIVYAPIPGQEERNCDYLLEQGAAVKAKSLQTLDYKVSELLDDPRRMKDMSVNTRRCAHPDAAKKVIKGVLDSLKG
jgi:processive 1,2-diacylglycerol beta-glucosyltransferase